jgi:hypothetical protein
MSGQTFRLTYPWDTNGYKPETVFTLRLGEDAFFLHVTVQEKNPRRVETRPMHFVHTDSCAEWFVQFQPATCAWYFNFEVNANGAMYASFRRNREEYRELRVPELSAMRIRAAVHEDFWEVSYRVPFSLIRAYIPDFTAVDRESENSSSNSSDGCAAAPPLRPAFKVIRANFYKCGDETEYPHYGMWRPYPASKPDFHRPDTFGEIRMVREGEAGYQRE